MPDDWQRVRNVFDAVRVLPAAEQQAFLVEFCNGEEVLKQTVLSLLHHDAASSEDGFLDWTASQPARDIHLGRQVGNYRLLDCIGSGATGVVYRAFQNDDVDRIVAVKLMRLFLNDADAERRFRVERLALAELTLPGVARLIDWGNTTDGTPYLVMDFIDGERVDHHLEQNDVDRLQRVRWFLEMARIVAAAHRKGISHRDLKPANILITHDHRVVITDFGLAKFIDACRPELQSLTATGSTLGTPGYMAPEQFESQRGSVGYSADIYGLGAVLYFLLTNRPPYRTGSAAETLIAMQQEEPIPPGRLRADIDRDIETICLKCLEKEPSRRYASVDELVADIELNLSDLPISARPISRVERAFRWSRRNPLLAASLVSVFVVTTIGLVAVSSLLIQTRRQNAELQLQRNRLIETVDDLFTENSKWLKTHPSTQDLRQQLLEQAQRHHSEITRPKAVDKESRIRFAEATFRLGNLLRQLRDRDASLGLGRDALEQFESLRSDYPKMHRFSFDVFHCKRLLGHSDQALDEISTLCEAHPLPDYLDAWAAAARERAVQLHQQGDIEQAREMIAIGLVQAGKIKTEFPGDPFYRRHFDGLSLMRYRLENNHEALLESSLDALQAIEKAIADDPTEIGYVIDSQFASGAAVHAAVKLDRTELAQTMADRYVETAEQYLNWDPQLVQAWSVFFDASFLKLRHDLFPSEQAREEFVERLQEKLKFANQFWPGESQFLEYTESINAFVE